MQALPDPVHCVPETTPQASLLTVLIVRVRSDNAPTGVRRGSPLELR